MARTFGIVFSGGVLNAYEALKYAMRQYQIDSGPKQSNSMLTPNSFEWYKISVNPGSYVFKTTGNIDTYAELYSDIQNYPIATFDIGGQGGNFNSTYTIPVGGTYYLKIFNIGATTSSYYLNVYSSHTVHEYTNRYEWISLSQHRSYCRCDDYYILSSHVLGGGSHGGLSFCNKCHGLVDFGVVDSNVNQTE